MSELTPFSYGAHQVRTILIDGEPWFVAADICSALELDHVHKALDRVDQADRTQIPVRSGGQHRPMWTVNESGMYELIIRSDKPEARKFRRWITSEVVPAIRKTGRYEVAADPQWQIPQSYAAALELAALQARELEAARPAVEFVGKFVSGAGTYLLREVAAVLNVKGMGQNNLFAFLRDHGVLIKDGDSRNLPYRRHIEADRFEVKVGQRDNSRTGEPVAVRTVRVTPRGLDYIRGLLESNGYRCMGDVA